MNTIQGFHLKSGEELPANFRDSVGEKLKASIGKQFNISPMDATTKARLIAECKED